MLLKLKCHQNKNVTKTKMSQTEILLTEMSQTEMSPKLKCR